MSDIAKPNFHAGKVIIVAQGVRISQLETALASSQEEIERLRKALAEIRDEPDVHTKLNQERLCCKFQDIAARALSPSEEQAPDSKAGKL